MKNPTKISCFLCFVLRHKPESINLCLDGQGWLSVDKLLVALSQTKYNITRSELSEVVSLDNKQRFSYSPDMLKIRANQGHSVDVDLGLPPINPPALLYHGTTDNFLEAILQHGLCKIKRHHVHLSSNLESAFQVGKRKGIPLILEINSEQMGLDGHEFYCSCNGVWLTSHVPAKYITEFKR